MHYVHSDNLHWLTNIPVILIFNLGKSDFRSPNEPAQAVVRISMGHFSPKAPWKWKKNWPGWELRGLTTPSGYPLAAEQFLNISKTDAHSFFRINGGANYLAAFLGVHLAFIDHYLPGATPAMIPLQLFLDRCLQQRTLHSFSWKMDTDQSKTCDHGEAWNDSEPMLSTPVTHF